jgi:hypothetical protein
MAPVQPQHWQGPAQFIPASFLLVADKGSDDRIVGFWKVTFVAEGNPDIPDGTPIDDGLAQWHSDGTEIMNSGLRPPVTGNFCLGVWQKSGRSSYKLNHFGLGWDANGDFTGPARIAEEVTVDHSGNHYEGTFTIDQYDPSGKLLAHVTGHVTATRITVDTSGETFFEIEI